MKKCTRHVIVGKNIGAHNAYNEEVRTAEIDDMASDNISWTIIFYVNQTLQTLLFAIGISTLGLPMGQIHQLMTRFVFHSGLSYSIMHH